MALNVNTIKTVINKVNSKGASLLRKETGLNISEAAKEGILIPKTAHTYDAVRVGRNNNPAEHYTDVFTFRDKNGQIVNRYIKQVDGQNVKETRKGYENLCEWEKDIDGSEENVLTILGKKVRSYTRENGKINRIQEDVFAITSEQKPYLTHFQKTITPFPEIHNIRRNKETILLEQRRNKEQPKFIKNEYIVDEDINGNFNLIKSQSSSPELEKIANNTHFLPYVSPDSKFAYRMSNACIKDSDFIYQPGINLYKEASGKQGFYCADININLKSSRDLKKTREALTDTIGHEVSHAKWEEKTDLYDMYINGFDVYGDLKKIVKPEEISQIKKYKQSIDHYIPAKKDYKGYLNQYCERVARADGAKAVKKYDDLSRSIGEEFPNMHGFQFYHPNYNEDSLQGLSSLLKAWLI